LAAMTLPSYRIRIPGCPSCGNL